MMAYKVKLIYLYAYDAYDAYEDKHHKYRCMVIFIPQNITYIGKTTNAFGCNKTHHFKPKLVLQVEQTT